MPRPWRPTRRCGTSCGATTAKATGRCWSAWPGKAADQLASGEACTARAIAGREKINEHEITRVLHLAFLSPRIVEDIFKGRQAEDVTVYRLSPRPTPVDSNRLSPAPLRAACDCRFAPAPRPPRSSQLEPLSTIAPEPDSMTPPKATTTSRSEPTHRSSSARRYVIPSGPLAAPTGHKCCTHH